MSKTIIDAEKLKQLLCYFGNNLNSVCVGNCEFFPLLKEAFPQEEEPVWKPKDGEKVWIYYADGEILDEKWTNSEDLKILLDQHRIFQTREQAEAFKKKYEEWIKTV